MSDMTVGGVDTVKLAKELHDLQRLVSDLSDTVSDYASQVDDLDDRVGLRLTDLEQGLLRLRQLVERMEDKE